MNGYKNRYQNHGFLWRRQKQRKTAVTDNHKFLESQKPVVNCYGSW
ncbi:hypothetical protein RUMGNA_00526 [Mediterraneibacter gnavus ATCC 29149]|uniref:Uncharacterized protein n=1 Tax=Mediterraneibacter gnavus (strain ATCC 29149 / DSM 114966 / JCM 6515 / VPI C7-9) TaxID=411470 RepID=A7AZ10_MEDG7|nr:hypothetical protein RUMGNA_00526 [Mediterraneibacter gnavus ATCC 29149]